MFIGPKGIKASEKAKIRIESFHNPIFEIEQAEISDRFAIIKNISEIPISTFTPIGKDDNFNVDLQYIKLEDVLDHQDIFTLYPNLRTIPVTKAHDTPSSTNESFFGGSFICLHMLSAKSHEEDILHEVQHAIQRNEDLSAGTSISKLLPKQFRQHWAEFQLASPIEREARNVVARKSGSNKFWFEVSQPGIGEPKSLKSMKYMPLNNMKIYLNLLQLDVQRELHRMELIGTREPNEIERILFNLKPIALL
jgi:hypothetical protein